MSAIRRTRPVDLSGWGDQPPRWIRLLAAEVEASNRTLAGKHVGISRSAVSLALANRYPSPSTDSLERRVLEALDGRDCPALSERISVEQCRQYRDRPAPTHNPMSMREWRACQGCPHNPSNQRGDT
ncbi:hypothetical protein FZZ93_02560 [Halomonas eurihalina]|uniref:Uncharacterized protein n=1 Tax=Halomonas eurihalina TaxID=42566 RepID=A0A5D9DE72_HALER|nr:hypothetical protein [Halomonas eurihalina]MDR5857924.1 hypothetical protein [Halomonas eurihalina]TZG41562.1 hypothetical protein FZZ93_02560 [Halomonas eurihalina]